MRVFWHNLDRVDVGRSRPICRESEPCLASLSAPEGYRDFDSGVAKKFVLDPVIFWRPDAPVPGKQH